MCVYVCVQPFPIDDSYCGERDMNHPIQGSSRDPVWREAALTWTGARVSTVAVTATGQHTVAFLGTVHGNLNKVSRRCLCCRWAGIPTAETRIYWRAHVPAVHTEALAGRRETCR